MAEQKDLKATQMDSGQLALRCAQFFMSLSESCLEFYHKYNKQKQRKSKQIKKSQKQKAKQAKRTEQQDDLNEDLKKKLPKKPLTAYIIYFQQKKPNFVERHPGLNLSDLTKLIAKQWKQIDGNERKPYLAQAQEDRKRYETEMKDFKAKYGTAVNNEDEYSESGIIEQENAQENENGNAGEEQIQQQYHHKNEINLDEEQPEQSNQMDNQNQMEVDNQNEIQVSNNPEVNELNDESQQNQQEER